MENAYDAPLDLESIMKNPVILSGHVAPIWEVIMDSRHLKRFMGLGILMCLFLSGCTKPERIDRDDYFPVDEITYNNSLYWLESVEDRDDIYSSYILIRYDFETHSQDRIQLPDDMDEPYLCDNNEPSGVLLINKRVEENLWEIFTITPSKELKLKKSLSISDCASIIAVYGDYIYYSNGSCDVFCMSMSTGDTIRYPDEANGADDVSRDGKVLKISYTGLDNVFSIGIFSKNGGSWNDVVLDGVEDAREITLQAACWSDNEHIIFDFIIDREKKLTEDIVYTYSVKDGTITPLQTKDQMDVVLEKSVLGNLRYNSLTMDLNQKYLAYILADDSMGYFSSFDNDIIVFSLETGKRYVVQSIRSEEGRILEDFHFLKAYWGNRI